MKSGEELKAFVEWIETLPNFYLKNKVIDAFYKGSLDGSDLAQAFAVHHHTAGKHSLVPQPERKS